MDTVSARRFVHLACLSAATVALAVIGLGAQGPLPELTQPVNDFAHAIDASDASAMDRMIRSLEQAGGGVVIVATVDTIAPYASIDDYAVKLFENRRRGIGGKEQDNGLLVVLAMK
jgi:uncharacterized protein